MSKQYLVTDLYHFEKYKSHLPKKYLEIPVFDKKNKLKKSIFFKRWGNYKEKIRDHNRDVKLYKFHLDKLTVFLNRYHQKNFSKRYWELILTPWLWWFISSVSFKWDLISSIKANKFIFLKKEIEPKEVIPIGIEDFTKMSTSHFWNHYIFSKIIEHSFSKKIEIHKIVGDKDKDIEEKSLIYKKLNYKTNKERLSLIIQKLLNFLPQRKSYLIFSTYLSNFQEIHLNFLTNKSFLFYKALRPNFLINKLKKIDKRKISKNLNNKKKGIGNFLSKEILMNLPSSLLENFNATEKIVEEIPFPKSPKKIFTCLGFNRSTLMDRYIAKNLENGTSLILAQHGGNFFQQKMHYDSEYEPKISDKDLTRGNIGKKNTQAIGVIKKINQNKKNSANKIILEVRVRKGYTRLKVDSGFLEAKKYIESLCKFFTLIKNNEINETLFVKLHQIKWMWNEKKQFQSHNPFLKFLDERKRMINEINSAKLIIHTFCGTGHLECFAANRPTVILFLGDINLYNEISKKYFKRFKKLGILYTNPTSLYKFLIKINSEDKIENWWNSKKIQELLEKYRYDFGFLNNNKIIDLKKIILNE